MGRMRNVTGSPVEQDDFFDRPREVQKVQRKLESGDSPLLTAPRRVGKTSLVLHICELCRTRGWASAFINVEGCTDELMFAEKLVDELQRQGLHAETMARMLGAFRSVRRSLGSFKASAVGVDVEIGDAASEEDNTLRRALDSIFRKVAADGKKVLIAVDEMPELLLNLSHQDDGEERVKMFLHWLRDLRQTHRQQIHWIFLGSIGLDSFVEGRKLQHLINDLAPVTLEALSNTEADAFLNRLSQDNGLPIAPPHRQNIINRLGWPLPYHLQIVFQALRDAGTASVDDAAIDDAFAFLLRPESLSQFDTWRQRLDLQLDAVSARVAKDMLRHLCQHHDGRTRAQVHDALMATRPQADPEAVREQISNMLTLLQRDGYLLESNGKYAFRSFLLREYWYIREVR